MADDITKMEPPEYGDQLAPPNTVILYKENPDTPNEDSFDGEVPENVISQDEAAQTKAAKATSKKVIKAADESNK